MDIRILPLKIEEPGHFSVYVVPTDDPRRPGFISVTQDNLPDLKTVIASLPKGLLAKDADHVIVAQNLFAFDKGPVFIVIGNEDAFAPEAEGAGRWLSQTHFVHGPLPEGIKDARELPLLFTKSLDADDLAALLASVHTMRAQRLGTEAASVIDIDHQFDWKNSAENPAFLKPYFDPKKDEGLPLLHIVKAEILPPEKAATPAEGRALVRLAQKFAALARRRPRAPRRASVGSMITSGYRPKPA